LQHTHLFILSSIHNSAYFGSFVMGKQHYNRWMDAWMNKCMDRNGWIFWNALDKRGSNLIPISVNIIANNNNWGIWSWGGGGKGKGECSFVWVRLKNMSKTKDHEFFLVLVELRFYFIQCIFPVASWALLWFGVGCCILIFL
jgi:hypothetical protein